MSSALVKINNTNVLRLDPHRLMVAFRLQGTIGHVDLNRGGGGQVIKPRPYLRYLADTLNKLRCDVTVVLPTSADQQQQQRAYHMARRTMSLARGAGEELHKDKTMGDPMLDYFLQKDFPVPHVRLLHEVATESRGGASRAQRGITSTNYTDTLHALAAQPGVGSNPDRILFIDSELNYRFAVPQQLVLEAFQPLTRRQRRHKRFKQLDEMALGEMTAEEMVRYGRLSPEAVRRWQWDQEIQKKNAAIEKQTKLLEKEMRLNAREGDSKRQKHKPPPQPPSASASAASPSSPSSATGRKTREAAAAQATHKSKREEDQNTTEKTAAAAEEEEGEKEKEKKEEGAQGNIASSLAVNMEDYTLIALAEMLAELASSGAAVREYLKVEPLVEKLRVPMYGTANYLPIENCDYIEELDWDHIRVVVKGEEEERLREEEKEEVVETEAHKDFFQ